MNKLIGILGTALGAAVYTSWRLWRANRQHSATSPRPGGAPASASRSAPDIGERRPIPDAPPSDPDSPV